MSLDLEALARAWTRAIGTTERRLSRFQRTGDRREYAKAVEAGRREDAARRAYIEANGPLPVPRQFPKRRVPGQGGAPKQGVFSNPDAMAGHSRKGLGLSAWWAKRRNKRGERNGVGDVA